MNLDDVSIAAWILNNKIKTETGRPFDLRTHLFWYDVLCDDSPLQVWLKAAQVGGSLSANLKLLWTVKKKKINAIYTLPTADDVKDFVSGKTNPLISMNPCISEWVTDKDSIEQKRIGNNTIYFRGTWTDRAALSVSSDLNVYDEEDRSKRSVIEQYASRLQHSPHKMEWHFSNPSTPGNGVSQYWDKSDKKHWFITCSSCSKKQYLSWPDSIDIEGERFRCKYCDKTLTEQDRRVGTWHKAKSQVQMPYSGYWFSLLMAPWITAKEIINLRNTKSDEYFHNFVLGLPYAGAGSSLNEDEFFQNITSQPYSLDEPIVIGCDTGLPNWYVIGSSEGVFGYGKCDGYSDIERMLNKWPKAVVVFDQGGDLYGQRDLQARYPGRVYLCYYNQDRKSIQMVSWGKQKEFGIVRADRNRMIQLLMDELRENRIPLHGSKADYQELWTHFANVYRVMEEDALGQPRHVWQRSGPDHLLHAFVYYRIGMDRYMTSSSQKFVTKGSGGLPKVVSGVHVSPEGMIRVAKGNEDDESDWRQI